MLRGAAEDPKAAGHIVCASFVIQMTQLEP